MFGKLSKLIHLNISGNPLVSTLDSTFTAFLTDNGLVHLQDLVMVNTSLRTIADNALSVLKQLVSLDIRGNEIEIHGAGLFQGLVNLRMLKTDDFKLCCPFVLPKTSECESPEDELSSCSDLLRLDIFRVFLWVISVLVVVGNAGVLVYAVIKSKETLSSPYRLLVANLAAADFLMGIYMTIIGSADAHFNGVYVVHEAEWRQSGTCITAGFLAFVSSEVSAFIICLITLDRFLKVCFPFKFQLHVGPRSCVVMCCVAWLCGVCLAAVPLIAQLQFYGVSGICLPLPITRHSFSGHGYAFGVFVMMNFVLFVLIGAGQAAIYRVIRASAKAAGSKRQQRDTTIARRLFLVVLTDFCCWFPIGVMGIMAFYGIPIPLQVNALVAVFVMPLNSALNPFLYTLNALGEKWAEEKTDKKAKKILGNLQAEILKLPPSIMEPLMRSYLRSNKAVNIEHFLRSLDDQDVGTATTSV
ncbi:G-protein coupled receptor GRL101-like [Littorina saxatilis]|uniref:G-protein coupled receptor GRL101-like n=1 Tax=Littorina saxatilis TaxID=31220 RepID=UPI0038B51986